MSLGRACAGVGLLLGCLLQACDRGVPVAPGAAGPHGTVAINLSTQPGCVSVIAEAVLTVTPEGGSPSELRQAIPAGAATVSFDDVEVKQGTVAFAVEILSNNGTLLYSSQVSQNIDMDTFSVPITVEKQAPVLEACPGAIVYDRQDSLFTPTLQVRNRGIETLDYQAVPPLCDDAPCLTFEVPGGSLAAGTTEPFFVFLPRMVPQASVELRLQSDQGAVPITVTLPQVAELVPVSLDSTGGSQATQDSVVMPVRVVVRNDGNVPAGIFKLAAYYTDSDGRFPTQFHVLGQPDQTYPFTSAPLEPGGEITIDGLVLLAGLGGGETVQVSIEVDSCVGDQFASGFCRVDEFDELNNFSTTIPVFIPSF